MATLATIEETVTADCPHRARTRAGVKLILCCNCGAVITCDQVPPGLPTVPPDWQRMGLNDLRLWYAREVLGAML